MLIHERVWQDPGVREALYRWDFGQLSRRVRKCASLRQEDMAALTGLSQGYLSMLEAGSRQLTNIDRALDFLKALGTPEELIGLPRRARQSPISSVNSPTAEDTRTLTVHIDPALPWTAGRMVAALNEAVLGEPMDRRRFITLSGAALTAHIHHWGMAEAEPLLRAQGGSRVSNEMVGHLQGTIDHLRHMDASGGSGSLADLAQAHLSFLVSTLKHGTYDEPTGRLLAGIAADTATQLGWFHFDAGRHAEAQRALVGALRAAHASADPRLGAGALSYIAIQAYSTGNPRDAVSATRAAREKNKAVHSPALHAMLLTRQARGYAKLGEREACLRALGEAADLAAAGHSEEDPGWLYWINAGEILGQTASCHLDLDDTQQAAEHFERAHTAMNPQDLRTRALFETRAASAHLRSGEREAGYAAAERAMALAENVRSARLEEHFQQVADELQTLGTDTRAADLLDRSKLMLAKGTHT